MTYELAKQLKDAGFPQHDEYKMCVPTLSELIEACGTNISLLGFNLTDKHQFWTAYDSWNTDGEYSDYNIYCDGKTPEETVAKLWLALNTSKEAKGSD